MALVLATACQGATPPRAASCDQPLGAAVRSTHAFDAADLRAAALPQSELGDAYARFQPDTFFGGFESNEERARDKSADPDKERLALERSGRLVGYQEMFVPPDEKDPVIRIFTVVGVFRDAAGASAYLAQLPAAGRFPMTGVGEEASGTRVVGRETLTRAYVRRGALLATVGVNRRDATDVNDEVIALARRLDERLRGSLSGELRGYLGKQGTEFGAERLQPIALRLADLGPEHSTLEEDFFLNGFRDNSEHATSPEEYSEFERCGRVTGYMEAFFGDAAAMSTGTHLFAEQVGAADYLARFADRSKARVGQQIDGVTIDAVEQLAASPLGEAATAVALAMSGGTHRVSVLVRRGRLIGEATVTLKDPSEARSTALALAAKLDARMAAELAR